MSKFCNNSRCKKYRREFDDEWIACPYCNTPLAAGNPDSSALVNGDANAIQELNNTVGSHNTYQDSHNSVSTHNTDSHNITYVFNGKSVRDLGSGDRRAEYRRFCQNVIKNSVISRRVRAELDAYALELELGIEERREIENAVKEISALEGADTMSSVDRMTLDFAADQIRNNSPHAGENLPKLEVLAETVELDDVQFYYNLLLAAENPDLCVKRFENRDSDGYWRTYWVYMAYVRKGMQGKAEKVLRELVNWPDQSQNNIVLLRCAGWLYAFFVHRAGAENKRMALRALESCASISYLLEPFRTVIEYMAGSGTGPLPLSKSAECNFYLERIFGISGRQEARVAPQPFSRFSGSASSTAAAPAAPAASAARKESFSRSVGVEAGEVINRRLSELGGVPASSSVSSRNSVRTGNDRPPAGSVRKDLPVRKSFLSVWGKYLLPLAAGCLLAGGIFYLSASGAPDPKPTAENGRSAAAAAGREGTKAVPASSGSRPAGGTNTAAGSVSDPKRKAEAVSSGNTNGTPRPSAVKRPSETIAKSTEKPAGRPSSSGKAAVAAAAKPAGEMTVAEAFDTGRSAAAGNDYGKAALYYKSAADRGDAAASYELALLYQQGAGVAKNPATAFTYMKAAAEANYTKAFRPLGEMYHGGRGVAKDRTKAEYWYKQAVANGDEQAKRILYNM